VVPDRRVRLHLFGRLDAELRWNPKVPLRGTLDFFVQISSLLSRLVRGKLVIQATRQAEEDLELGHRLAAQRPLRVGQPPPRFRRDPGG